MLKKRRLAVDILLLAVFCIFLWLFIHEVRPYTKRSAFSVELPVTEKGEIYDASLSRLNTIDKLEAYCDSLYMAQRDNAPYPYIVSGVVREKFYHGYSYYGKGHNVFATFFEPVLIPGVSAIVIPEDIVKYPSAACSQQCIVAMEILKRKNIPVRKIGMYDEVVMTGHFAFEAWYDGDWHYFDPDREPDRSVLNAKNRPSAKYLSEHPELVSAAYKSGDVAMFQRLLRSHVPGEPNAFPAPKALIYHKATNIMSHTVWLFVGLILFIRVRKNYSFLWSPVRRRKKREDLVIAENYDVQYR